MIQYLQKLFKKTPKKALNNQSRQPETHSKPNLQLITLPTEKELKDFALKHGGGYYNCDCQEEADALTKTHVDFIKKALQEYSIRTRNCGYEFYVIMLKRRDGNVYPDLHKTTEKIYLEPDDEDLLEDLEEKNRGWLNPPYHIVKLVAFY